MTALLIDLMCPSMADPGVDEPMCDVRVRVGPVSESGDATGGQEIEIVETTDVGAEASRGAAGGAIGGGAIVTVDCEEDETDELRSRMRNLGAAGTDVYRETWLG